MGFRNEEARLRFLVTKPHKIFGVGRFAPFPWAVLFLPFRPMEYGHSPVFFGIGRFENRPYNTV
jgi:hypothetical protein